ncbi:PepSY domain-containing protein [Bacteriovorax sp. Seq25_V]|uniref:PepSY domain-containing protein n=1 Tax=Bacteriovorax sp. Seq25_V TaxID=1201288 RepID=UPI00038A28A8|nr:PepSY domain-containing protein [Bacteriovorax sp. Seq25_V]EQC48078.1 hypothetical protein M900_A0009 [Bacteriovorax sp. Seq25_V]
MNKKKIIVFILTFSILAIIAILIKINKQQGTPDTFSNPKQESKNTDSELSKEEQKHPDVYSDTTKSSQDETRTEVKTHDNISPEELEKITKLLAEKNPLYKVESIKIDRIYDNTKYEVTIKTVNKGLNHYIKAYLDPNTGVLSKTWGGTRYENRDHMIIPVKK